MIELAPGFDLVAHYRPTGDQPQAIDALVRGLREHKRDQVLLGVTGSGKTFTVANVIAEIGLPTLVISHNKTLAAQLYGEFKGFFPRNAVGTSFPITTTTSPKRFSLHQHLHRQRTRPSTTTSIVCVRATSSLMTRKDVTWCRCVVHLRQVRPKTYAR